MAVNERHDLILMDLHLPEIDGGGDALPQG